MKAIIFIMLITSLAFSQKQENLTAKYMTMILANITFFEMGAEQGYWMTEKHSKWPAYSPETAHAHWFLQRASMVSAGMLAAHWHPQQRFLSGRTLVQFIGTSCMLSWVHNRGLRLVQTGELFPPERGHSFYIDFGFIRIEVKSTDELQWGMLGAGVALLTLDTLWNKL